MTKDYGQFWLNRFCMKNGNHGVFIVNHQGVGCNARLWETTGSDHRKRRRHCLFEEETGGETVSCCSVLWILLMTSLHTVLFYPSLQEQSSSDETDMQLIKAHSDALRDTLRDIAQVNVTQWTPPPRFMAGPHVRFVSQTVLSDGESSSEADQDNSSAPLLALICDSSPHRSTSPRRPPSPPQSSSSSLPDAALSALRSAVRNKALQLQVTCRFACPQWGSRIQWLLSESCIKIHLGICEIFC